MDNGGEEDVEQRSAAKDAGMAGGKRRREGLEDKC